jgi:hypothetical protein
MSDYPPPPAWIRVLAVIFVLPFRLLWELLRVVGRFLSRYVGRPLAWLWHYAVEVPLAFLWHYLIAVPGAFLWRYLVVIPGVFLWRYLVVSPGVFLWRYVVVVPVRWLWAHVFRPALVWGVVAPLAWLWSVTAPMWRALGRGAWWLLSGLGRGIAVVLIAGWQGAGWVLRQFYRWLLRPVGLAASWCWRYTVVPAYRMIAAGGRWVREEILRPAAGTARAVLVSVGLRR